MNYVTENILPVRITDFAQGVENSQTLLREKSVQIALDEPAVCRAYGGFIVLDFGREYSGGVRVLCHTVGGGNVKIRIRFGESYTEANAEIGYKGMCNDHSPRDFYAEICDYSDLTFGQTGFRFVRLDFPSGVKTELNRCMRRTRTADICKSAILRATTRL